MAGKTPRQKGNRLERTIVAKLKAAGLDAKRVPLSGSAAGFPGDVVVKLAGRTFTLEAKSRKDFKTLYSWLEDRDALILKGDRREPLLILRLDDALVLLEKSHG